MGKRRVKHQAMNLWGATKLRRVYQALRPKRPLVTSCCGTLNWVNAFREDGSGGVDICLYCKKETTVQFISLEQYNQHYTNYPITEEHFNSLWDTKI